MNVIQPRKPSSEMRVADVGPHQCVKCGGRFYVTTVRTLRDKGIYAVGLDTTTSWIDNPDCKVLVVKANVVLETE